MSHYIFCTAGHSPAIEAAANILKQTYVFSPELTPEATHLLLPVPSLSADSSIIGGGNLSETLAVLPKSTVIIGGNLRHPKLAAYKTVDLLQDPEYLAQNANITAHCAVRYALEHLPVIIENCPVLILGWGRIARCLAKLLERLGADVTIAARKETDRAMAGALGYAAINTTAIDTTAYRLIYNTIPSPSLLPEDTSAAIKVDLASISAMEGDNVIHARGLPGKFAPESSGKLIARTVLRLLEKEESL